MAEMVFSIDTLLTQITKAMSNASAQLLEESATGTMRHAPFIYHMPKMTCQVKLSLSYTKEGVKGVFKRSRTAEEHEIVSTIELEVVAVPRGKSVA